MSKKQKISEAAYFYNKMLKVRDNADYFHYKLSAFLSATRSPLQYSHEEVSRSIQGKKWYENKISNSPILRFFGDKRDFSIHKKAIRTPTVLVVSGRMPTALSVVNSS